MWLIENQVFPDAEERDLQEALREAGIPFSVFSGSDLRAGFPHPVPEDVVRGSCWWVSQLADQPGWEEQKWGTVEDFQFSSYADRFGTLLLNGGWRNLTFHELCWRGIAGNEDSESLFVRPDDGFKSFEGQLVRSSEFAVWVQRLQLLQVRGSLPVIVAPRREIRAEWRLVMIDGDIAAGSQYRPTLSRNIPDAVKSFAAEAHRIGGPSCRCYVLDIADTTNGLRVVEIGCVCCVAFYESSMRDIVRSISSL